MTERGKKKKKGKPKFKPRPHCLGNEKILSDLLEKEKVYGENEGEGDDDSNRSNSLRVAVPTPRGKTGGRERLRKADTNRVM